MEKLEMLKLLLDARLKWINQMDKISNVINNNSGLEKVFDSQDPLNKVIQGIYHEILLPFLPKDLDFESNEFYDCINETKESSLLFYSGKYKNFKTNEDVYNYVKISKNKKI
jgi:hypothetical protein